MRLIFITLIATLAAACTNPSTISETTTTVDRSFSIGSGGTSNGSNQFNIGVKAFNAGGRLSVCAAIAVDGTSTFTDRWGAAIANVLKISINDERVMQNAKFAATYEDEATVMGKIANCVVTAEPWKPEWDGGRVGFRTGPMRVFD